MRFDRFTDINYCVTEGIWWINLDCLNKKEACYDAFKDFMVSKVETFGIIGAIATLICLINIVTVCCLCYHPVKRHTTKNFYSRMMEDWWMNSQFKYLYIFDNHKCIPKKKHKCAKKSNSPRFTFRFFTFPFLHLHPQ